MLYRPPPKQYVSTEIEIRAAMSVLELLPRRKSVNPEANTYTDLKRFIETVSGEYVSAWGVVVAAERLGFRMHYGRPRGHNATLNISQRGVRWLQAKAQEIERQKREARLGTGL
jgi:hypothetical protein